MDFPIIIIRLTIARPIYLFGSKYIIYSEKFGVAPIRETTVEFF